jgi:arylsulfatase A-like enzyme
MTLNRRRPNIVFFMTDHQRFDMAPPYDRAITPNLDRFHARYGATAFTSAYCPAPHCCPSRATLFSGLYPSEHGVWNNVNVGNRLSAAPYDEVRLWSEDLATSGYRMGFSGKWHVSDVDGPGAHGFTEVFNPARYTPQEPGYHLPTQYEWDLYYADFEKMKERVESGINRQGRSPQGRMPAQLLRTGYPRYTYYGKDENPFGDGSVVEEGLKILDGCAADRSSPFLLYIGTVGPHDPYYVPGRFLDLYKDVDLELPDSFTDDLRDKPNLYRRVRGVFDQMPREEQVECLRHYLAFCSYEDHLFGRLLDRLESLALMEDTVLVCLSDHGDYAGDHGLWAKGLPCFDGAYHVPLLVGGFGLHGPITEDAFVSLADIAPTMFELAGIPIPEGRFSGRSLLPLLAESGVAEERALREAVFTQTNGNELYGIQRSVRTREWKYVFNGFDFDELYDLTADPGETVNRIDDPALADVRRGLAVRLWRFAHLHKDVCINPYVMVGLAEFGPGVAFDWE